MIGGRGALAFSNQWNVDTDEIRSSESRVEVDVLDPGLFFGQAPGKREIFDLLHALHEVLVFEDGVVAEDVHIESGTFPDHRLADSSCSNNSNGLSRDFVSEERQVRVPKTPLMLTKKALGVPEPPGNR